MAPLSHQKYVAQDNFSDTQISFSQDNAQALCLIHSICMKKKELKDLLQRVETWPKADQEAAYDSLSMIEEERHVDPAIAEDIIRSREDIKQGRLTSQEDLIRELHLFGH